jgi:CheY-like chemotaxis protein
VVRRTPRVAVLDDDDEFADLMEALLGEEGFSYVRVAAGSIDLLIERAVDVLVLDLRGDSEEGGLETLHRIRSHRRLKHLPVLVCSADIQQLRANAGRLALLPAVTALEKPFRIEALTGALERLLAGSRYHPPPASVSPTDPEGTERLTAWLAEVGVARRWPVLDLWVPADRPGFLRCAAAWAASRRHGAFVQLSRRTLLPFGAGLPGRIWASGRAAWIDNLAAELNLPRQATARKVGLVSAAGVPVMDGDDVMAVLAAYDQRLRALDAAELDRLRAASIHAGELLRELRAGNASD